MLLQGARRLISGTARLFRASAGSTLYEGASQTRRTFGFRSMSATPNAMLANLETLRNRSRAAVRDNGYAKGAIEKLVTNIVGTGIKPMSQAADPVLRQLIDARWLRWTDESDADGLLDFYGQEAQAVRAWLEAGEVFIRLRPRLLSDGLTVPLQIQVIEPELCPHTHNITLENGNRIRAGIEFNAIGQRVAYWFYQSRPGDLQDFDAATLRRIPAALVRHLYEPTRAGQLRGLPHLTQAILKLASLEKYTDAVALRQELANLFVAFLTNGLGADGASINPLTGLPTDTDADNRPILALEPGIFQELQPGQDVKFSTPPETGTGYKDFVKQQLFAISAATGVPYEALTGDMSGVNDRTVRVIFNEFRMRIQTMQHHIVAFQVCRPIWRAWMDRAFLSGALPIGGDYLETPDAYLAAKWTPPRTPYIHPVQDVDAQEKAIKAGLTSRSAAVSELGEDAATIDAEQAADNARADKLGLRYDSDPRYKQTAAATPAPASTPDDADAGDASTHSGAAA